MQFSPVRKAAPLLDRPFVLKGGYERSRMDMVAAEAYHRNSQYEDSMIKLSQ
jgi:hypothetical protein